MVAETPKTHTKLAWVFIMFRKNIFFVYLLGVQLGSVSAKYYGKPCTFLSEHFLESDFRINRLHSQFFACCVEHLENSECFKFL